MRLAIFCIAIAISYHAGHKLNQTETIIIAIYCITLDVIEVVK